MMPFLQLGPPSKICVPEPFQHFLPFFFNRRNQLSCGSSVRVLGNLVPSKHKGQEFEIHADKVEILGPCNNEKFPFRPRKSYNSDYVRSHLHLKPRLTKEAALLRVRNAALVAVHSIFQVSHMTSRFWRCFL